MWLNLHLYKGRLLSLLVYEESNDQIRISNRHFLNGILQESDRFLKLFSTWLGQLFFFNTCFLKMLLYRGQASFGCCWAHGVHPFLRNALFWSDHWVLFYLFNLLYSRAKQGLNVFTLRIQESLRIQFKYFILLFTIYFLTIWIKNNHVFLWWWTATNSD